MGLAGAALILRFGRFSPKNAAVALQGFMAASLTPQPAPVMFTCPAKDAPTFTGHRMRPAEFSDLRDSRSFRCSDCGAIHSWTAETAWLRVRAPV
jgi:hypothetical protein